jgi:hypothetical protein
MIIGYYPGAGGNRYYNYLKGIDYSELGIAYDGTIVGPKIRGEYFNGPTESINVSQDMLLHCVNSKRIREIVTTEVPITIIKSDLKRCLRREWSIKGKHRPMFQDNIESYEFLMLDLYQGIRDSSWPVISTISEFNVLPPAIHNECMDRFKSMQSMLDSNSVYNFLNSAYTAIIWHTELYQRFPIETSLADHIVDIETDQTVFARLMRKELDLYNNTLFDFAWDVFCQHGADAPINDLYEQQFCK